MNNLNFTTWKDALNLFAKRVIKSELHDPSVITGVQYLYALYRRHFDSDDKRYLMDFDTADLMEELLERYDYPYNKASNGKPLFSLKNAEGFLIVFQATLSSMILHEEQMVKQDDAHFSHLVNILLKGRLINV